MFKITGTSFHLTTSHRLDYLTELLRSTSRVSDTRDTCLAAEGTRVSRNLRTMSEGLVFTAINRAKRVDPDSRQIETTAKEALPAITKVID
jgi:hypothetical protein